MRKTNSSKRGTLTSFDELSAQFGLKPIRFQTKDKKKLEQQRENFSSRHLCPACGKPLKLILGTNIMTCVNHNCEGIKRERIDEETGEKIVSYYVPSHQLDEKGMEIANNIFAELD